MGEYDKAIDDWTQAIRRQGENATVYAWRGHTHSAQGKSDLAMADYTEALRLAPGHPLALCGRALELAQLGQSKEAEKELEQIADIRRSQFAMANLLAWFLATCPDPRLRRPQQAIALAEDAVGQRPVGYLWTDLGVAHYRAGNWNEALKALATAAEMPSYRRTANSFFLAMTYRQLENTDDASKWYFRAVDAFQTEQPNNEQLRRFRAEAAALLGVTENLSTETEAVPES